MAKLDRQELTKLFNEINKLGLSDNSFLKVIGNKYNNATSLINEKKLTQARQKYLGTEVTEENLFNFLYSQKDILNITKITDLDHYVENFEKIAKEAPAELLKQQQEDQEAIELVLECNFICSIVDLYNTAVKKQNGIKPSCAEALTKFLQQDLFEDHNLSNADKNKLSKAFKGMYSAYNGEQIKDIKKISQGVHVFDTFKAFVREIIRICLIVPAVAKFVFGNDSDSFIRGYRSTRENKNDFAAGVGSFKDLVAKRSNQEINL